MQKSAFEIISEAIVPGCTGLIPTAERLALPLTSGFTDWCERIRANVLPRCSSEFPLVAAITGGGSAGKSTLFNSLCRDRISPVGGKAGINRRALAALHPAPAQKKTVLTALFSAFEAVPALLEKSDDVTRPGPPLFTTARSLPPQLVLFDTPDFDTGAKGHFDNRQWAEPTLSTADVLVYIFTNTGYNNKENTDYIARMLHAFGHRPCFLVYRTSSDIDDQTALRHARIVAANLYGEAAENHIAGIFRTSEDNRVAARERFMELTPIDGQQTDLMDRLGEMNAHQLRQRLYAEVIAELKDNRRRFEQSLKAVEAWLKLYRRGIDAIEAKAVKTTMGHLPLDFVLNRFSQIWMATDPTHIKWMRNTGRVLDKPVKLAFKTVQWMRRRLNEVPAPAPEKAPVDALQQDLLAAASLLYAQLGDTQLEVTLKSGTPASREMAVLVDHFQKKAASGGFEKGPRYQNQLEQVLFTLPLPPALKAAQTRFKQAPWAGMFATLTARKNEILTITDELEKDLTAQAIQMRQEMGLWDQARQTASAALNILPATAAVTYILSTGDPVGATGIQVKLASLFGLHDLYALLALPVASGIKEADQQQLLKVLEPVARKWLNSRLVVIQELFQETISGLMRDEIAALGKEAKAGEELTKAVERKLLGVEQ